MSRTEPPSVSIVVACLNAGPWIAAAIESALAQQGSRIVEVLVLDDGSTDDTVEVLRRFGDRIELVESEHRGCASARNELLARARGEWLQYLDADDVLDADKIATQCRLVTPKIDVVVAPIRGPNDSILHRSDSDDPWIDLMRLRLGITTANLWRREAVISVGGWSENLLLCLEYELMLRLLVDGRRIAVDTEPRSNWGTQNPESLSRRDTGLRDLHVARFVHRVADHLRTAGALSGERGRAAAERLLALARSQWCSGHPSWGEVVDLLHDVDPEPWALATAGRGVYASLYRALGFAWAQRYDAAAARLRRPTISSGR